MHRRVLLVLLMVCSELVGHAQDPSRRMDPDAWYNLAEVQDAWRILKTQASHYGVEVQFPKGQLEMLSGSNGRYYSRIDDMRLVLDSAGNSISRSHNHGFNVGARHFYHEGNYFAVGGSGFWHAHANLIEFVPFTGEWELQPCVNSPDYVSGSSAFFDEKGRRVVSMRPLMSATDTERKKREVCYLDLDAFEWHSLGILNPILDIHFYDRFPVGLDLEEYFIWLGIHKAVILRKSDMSVVVSTAFNRTLRKELQSAHDLGDGGYRIMRADEGHWQEFLVQGVDAPMQAYIDWDVKGAFEGSTSERFPFWVPHEPVPLEPESHEVERAPWAPIALLACAFAFFLGWRMKPRQPRLTPRVNQNEGEGKEGQCSPLLRSFLESKSDTLDTQQLNMLLGLDEEQSEETKRARRAQAIRRVNEEYQLRYGVDLIERKKDVADRRRTTYIIRRHSNSA